MKLGSWLIARGRITGIQLKRALLDQSFYGGHLSSSLMKLGYLDEPTLGEYLSELFHAPYAASDRFRDIPPEVIRMIPESLAHKHRMIPLLLEGKKLHLAMMNPTDILVLDEVAFLTGHSVEPFSASEEQMTEGLERYYGIARSVRPTIPLAGKEDAEGSRAPRRAPVADIPHSPAPAPSSSTREETGIDGHPLSASADVAADVYHPVPTGTPPAGSLAVPRTLDEWRGGEREVSVPEATPLVPAPAALPADRASDAGPPADLRTAPVRPALSLVPPATPRSLEAISDRLREARGRDEVFEAILDFAEGRFSRSVLLLVASEKVLGWGGRGDGLDPEKVRGTTIGFAAPSLFSYFRMGSEFYFGPVPALPANLEFYRGLGVDPPERALLIPVQIKGRLIAIFYGDYGVGKIAEPDIALFRRLIQKACLALEVLILRNKISMV